MKNFKVIIFGLILGLVATTTMSFAGMGHGAGMMNSQTSLTAEQQQQLDAVKEKYAAQLDKLQADYNNKVNEYRTARTDQSTTIGSLNKLEAEAQELQRQYWTLQEQANNEAIQSVGNGQWFTCGYDNCDQHNDVGGNHMGMMNGGGMMNGCGMMHGGTGQNQQGHMNCDNHMGTDHNGTVGQMARCW
jgi:hypothetical protein